MAVLTIGSPRSKELVNKERNKVLRINLALAEPNKEWCPVFNYENLVKSALEKKESENSASGLNRSVNGSAFSLSDDEEKSLKKIARQFEEKYGGNGKRKRCQTYTELGAGYDENDSFIDNTEACEEILLEQIPMKHDGYFINCERYDKDSFSEKSDEDVQQKNKRSKRIPETSEDDTQGTFEEKGKKPKVVVENPSSSTEETEHKKTKRRFDSERKKKSKAAKSRFDDKKTIVPNQKSETVVGGEPDSKRLGLIKEDHKSVTEVIESVVNAIKNDSSEDSTSSSQTGSSTTSESSENHVATANIQDNSPHMPEVLPMDLDELVLTGLLKNS